MLSKLIGYEFRATRRIFIPAYLALLALSVLNAISLAFSMDFEHINLPVGLLLAVYVVTIMAIAFLSLAYMIVRFHQNLLGDEGYLMFTLPVRPWQLLWSKAIVSTVWMVGSVILCSISIFVVMVGPMLTSGEFSELMRELPLLYQMIAENYGAGAVGMAAEGVVYCIVCVIAFCMQVYAAMSLGQLFNRFRLAWSFVMYVLCSVVQQIVFVLVGNVFGEFGLFRIELATTQLEVVAVLLLMILWTAAIAVVYFVISNYLLGRKLNLQ